MYLFDFFLDLSLLDTFHSGSQADHEKRIVPLDFLIFSALKQSLWRKKHATRIVHLDPTKYSQSSNLSHQNEGPFSLPCFFFAVPSTTAPSLSSPLDSVVPRWFCDSRRWELPFEESKTSGVESVPWNPRRTGVEWKTMTCCFSRYAISWH